MRDYYDSTMSKNIYAVDNPNLHLTLTTLTIIVSLQRSKCEGGVDGIRFIHAAKMSSPSVVDHKVA